MLDISEKIKIVKDNIENIEFHISGFKEEMNTPFFQNDLYNEFILKKSALEAELEVLTNQI